MDTTLLTQAKNTYILALETHIKLLNLCFTSHQATQETYEGLFDIFHELSEKQESIVPTKGDDDELVSTLYTKVELLKESLKEAIPKEKDEGSKNQLISKYDDIQLICAKLKSLIEVEKKTVIKMGVKPY